MPLIRPRHVLSFSSEDVAQPAQNLLKSETYRKWRCATAGEKQASIILELERATQIHSIDIGNNGSALVEVLVGRSSWSSDEQYQVLLVASSFMSPAESKSFTNINKFRTFGPDKLSKPVAAQKWDRIKLVCTQPFNKNEQYGLSFINLHSPPEDTGDGDGDAKKTTVTSPSVSNPASKRLGRFTLKDDSDNEGKSVSSGSLFFKKLQKKASPPPLSMAAEVRAASTSAASSSDDRKAGDISSVKGTTCPDVKDRHMVAKDRHPVAKDRQEVASDRLENVGGRVSPKPEGKATQRRTSESTKRKYEDLPKENSKGKSPPPTKKKREFSGKDDDDGSVAFHEIMKDVMFVMSGFVNPERGNLRDKALQMGAQYKQDWGKGCTHLICAFANTPKFNQVKGKGKIVTKKWITDCFKKNKRLPTRNYHLPGDSSSSDESSGEENIKPKRPTAKRTTGTESRDSNSAGTKEETSPASDKRPIGKTTQASDSTGKKDEANKTDNADDIYGGSTDDESPEVNPGEKKETVAPLSPKETSSSSDRDTEDELKRVQEEEKEEEDDIYGGTTDDEQEEMTKKDDAESADDVTSSPEAELPELPEFFAHKHFMLYGEIEGETRRLLIRYITAYNGVVEEYMNDNVDFVITNEDWDRNFDEALNENASLAFVRPNWIMVCHEKGAFVPFQPYIIVPS